MQSVKQINALSSGFDLLSYKIDRWNTAKKRKPAMWTVIKMHFFICISYLTVSF